MNSSYLRNYAPAGEALEARLALRMTARLSQVASELPGDVNERLRFAREQALSRARAARAAQPVEETTVLSHLDTTLSLVGREGKPRRWLQLASVLPLVALVAGLVLIQRIHDSNQIAVAAEIDASLLSDDLPPSAYSDPGFVEFLKSPSD